MYTSLKIYENINDLPTTVNIMENELLNILNLF